MNTLSQEVYDRQKIDHAIKGLEGIITDTSNFVSDHNFSIEEISNEKIDYILSETDSYANILLSELNEIENYVIEKSDKITPDIIEHTIEQIYLRVKDSEQLNKEYNKNSEFTDKSDIISFNYGTAQKSISYKLGHLNSNNLIPLLQLDLSTESLEIIERSNCSLYELMETIDKHIITSEQDHSDEYIAAELIGNYR